ncbi:C2H2 type zinc finger domain-containing protein [Dendryphion nanum]|uniref:C2H2 type zinc finger domain-containing protein n=1 Tax=Dendryphion nanum TaxID=256645 RepID=A0A9P9DRK9_9PLEO|nr:C2H2 type zinc finger domain-containing protein [Dendryphion nanum]
MDHHQRGRSPSAGQRTHIRHSPSPSPHGPFHNPVSGLGLDQQLSANDPYTTSFNSSAVTTAGQPFDPSSSQYLTTSQSQSFSHTAAADQHFLQPAQLPSQHSSPHFGPQGSHNHLSPDSLDINNPNSNNSADNLHFNNFYSANGTNQDAIDPTFLSSTLDPQLLASSQPQNQSVNPSDLMNQMATAQAHSPTPPHMLQANMNHRSPSPHASPNMNQGAFPSPSHSRHASLDPNAVYGQGQASEWNNMAAFRGHRRAPSETYSDVSSAHASPYLGNNDNFDDNPSPLLNPQQDPSLFSEVMQFGQFNLNDSNAHISPGHSPHISPRLIPQQQSLPQFQPGSFGLEQNMGNQYVNQGIGIYQQGPGQEPFPTINQSAPEFAGQADTMSPPEINIDFAPPSRQASFEPPKPPNSADALSPPDRSRSRNRIRAKSDPFSSASSRASTPASDFNRSLSPSHAKSRSPSPSNKSSRRSSTSSVPNRDYILDLADPSRPTNSPGDGSGPKRTQKHPATFQCTLCPKRFTRAYNLRSHLRTHTDERPFVCSVCGKAFARQHDRKRHEGLHSGEKKFVCRGILKDNNNWGCGRRFARADALGRHFRSEAGRVCIRPLLEEEAQEKGGWDQNQQLDNGNGMFGHPMSHQQFGGMMGAPQSGYEQYPPGMDPSGGVAMPAPQYGLPAALLAQYPALAGIQWDSLPPGNPDDVEGDISGRSSFDASSGGELFDEDEGGAPYAIHGGWASDYEANAR